MLIVYNTTKFPHHAKELESELEKHGFAAEVEELAEAGYDCEPSASVLEDAEEQQRKIDEAAAAEKKAVANPLHRQLQITLVLLPVINGMILSLIQ